MSFKDEYTSVELAKELDMPMSTIRSYVAKKKLTPTGSRKSTRGYPMHTFNRAEVERFIRWRYQGRH